ncbi:MAG: hypothetical protein FD187_1806 [bacterium]|nr:MAG: hypothetical protein FD142_1131 [bacterium]KAF0148617.1 MAG: hypothetical protein FD187_1806 [bacterium]KAF0167921.1 MAG: hypothetical protein FD158_1816 [bacterium]TXT20034.1 MAG: hypothetical protein FD132_1531 [bacterium]
MRAPKLIMTALAMAITLGAGTAYPADEVIHGSQLMTAQERIEYRNRMHTATTALEREQIRLEHHQAMQARAKAQGKSLPDAPPALGGGMGPGWGPGGGGMGPGGGRNR